MKKRFQSCFEKREQMLFGARDSVAESGMEGVSTREIAAKAKLNGAYIYYLFDSKEDLLEKAYLQDFGSLTTVFLSEVARLDQMTIRLSEEERRWELFSAVWEFLLEEPNRCRFLYYYYHSAEFHRGMETYQKRMLRRAFQKTSLGEEAEGGGSMMDFERESLYFTILFYAMKVLDGVFADKEAAAHRAFQIIQASLNDTPACRAKRQERVIKPRASRKRSALSVGISNERRFF